MKIIVNDIYKSLSQFESDELKSFAVLIGKNGSGKSQLIELITKKTENKNFKSIDISPEFNRIQVEGLSISNISSLTNDFWKGQTSQYYNYYSGTRDNTRNVIAEMIKLKLTKKSLDGYQGNNSRLLDFFSKIKMDVRSEKFKALFLEYDIDRLNISFEQKANIAFASIFNNMPERFFEVTSFVCEYKEKDLKSLTEVDFLDTPIPEKYFDNNDLIHSNLAQIFYSFLKRRYINEIQYFKKVHHKELNGSVSFKEFDEQNRAPWDIINDIFEKIGLNYKFREINSKDFSPEAIIFFDLIKRSSNQKIEYQFLSSGEKILIGLVIKVFTKSFYQGNLNFPDLIVLDEPDAHLHPEMSKQLIEVLNDVFVEELGIHVILTTHSPSTVALSPEDNIYILSNEPKCSLKKISKDSALKLLTENLPNLSVNYKNHRQVFVESPTDLEYYQTIFNLLRATNKYNHELYFISNGYGKGNCNQVEEIISKLRESGNATCYGIIDWDHKNQGREYVYVHGSQSRYNLESFLFDPVFVAVLFLELQYGDLKKHLKIDNNYNPYKLVYDQGLLQKGIDFIWNAFVTKYPSVCKIDEFRIEKEYYKSEMKINSPIWFFNQKGHGVKDKYIQTFPVLQGLVNKGEYALEQKIIETIARLFPFVPAETISIIEELAE